MNNYILLPQPREIKFSGTEQSSNKLDMIIDPDKIPYAEGYLLSVNDSETRIIAHDEAGLFYAKQTLSQLELQAVSGALPCVDITDWPDFPNRGIMLDVSRDRVPTMNSLFKMIDMFASWKINHLELYIEHTFAYKRIFLHREPYKPLSISDLIDNGF